VTIALRNFEAGDVVLAEPPAIVFKTDNGYFGLFNAFLDAPTETQRAILEMHHTPVDDIEIVLTDPRQSVVSDEIRRYYSSVTFEYAARLDERLARNLVSIVDSNAHAYSTQQDTKAGDTTPDSMALFVVGSKIEHSCAPTCSYRNTETGMLEYLAEVPIKQGDRLSFSYAPTVYELPRNLRQEFLLTNKNFVCHCKRCVGLDECVPLTCCEACKGGVIFQNGSEEWMCAVCGWKGMSTDDILGQVEMQEALTSKVVAIKASLQSGVDLETFAESLSVQSLLADELHSLHWLHPMSLDIVSLLACAFARMLMKEGQSAYQLAGILRTSAVCQLQHILWVQRSVSVVQGSVTLTDAAASLEGKSMYQVTLSPEVGEVETILDMLVNGERPLHDNTVVAHHVFSAGLDLALAGHADLAAKLYTRYRHVLSRWKTLSAENRQNIDLLVESNGQDNRFENHLLR